MNIKTTVWLAIFMIGFGKVSQAQYDDATHRQTTDDVKRFKSSNLKTQIQYLQQGGGSIPYGTSYYDTGGRVVMIANPNHHEHFAYNDKGRMVYWLDSAYDGRRFEKHEYYFGYDDKGMVNLYKTSTTESKFSSTTREDLAKNGESKFGSDIKEDMIKNGIVVERRMYAYNPDGKLTEELHNEIVKDSVGKLLYSRKVFYNKYGDLASEIIYNPLKDCKGDSTIIINTYDSKAKLIHKQKSIKKMKCGASPSITERKTSTESISYTYNAGGDLIVEAMTSSDPALNYREEYVYNEKGIIIKQLGFDDKGKSTTDILYSYIYFPIKKR